MTDEHVDQLLSQVRAELDVTPSPGFAAGVRARIADAPASKRAMFRWPVVAVASATAIVAAVAVMMRGSSVPAAPASAPAVAVAPAVEPAPVASASAKAVTPVTPVAPAVPRVASRTLADATTPALPTGPSLEVITNQGAVLQAVWRRARGGDRAFKEVEPEQATATTAGPVADPAQPIVLPPVTIDPIVISALGGSSGGGGAAAPGGPTIRRVDAGRNR
jgi:hypothetical protein